MSKRLRNEFRNFVKINKKSFTKLEYDGILISAWMHERIRKNKEEKTV